MQRILAAVLLFCLPSVPSASAQAAASDASFSAALRAGGEALALRSFARGLQDKDIARRLSDYLGWYGEMELRPAMDTSAMSRIVVSGLTSGEFTGLILGESHGVDDEDRAGRAIVGGALDAGVPVGAFLREENLFPQTGPLDARKVPVLTYRNQFKPEADVQAGLAAAGKKLLISYTGCAHTSGALKDYFLYTLEEGKTWHYERGTHDMPTVEQSFLGHGKKPLIVAMSAEDYVLSRIQYLFLQSLVGDGAELPRLRADLDALVSAWNAQMAAYPARREIAFVRSAEQPNLYAGLTPTDRRAYDVEAVRRVLALPELAAWLGGAPIKSVESLRGGSFTPPDTRETHYDVIVHKSSGEEFRRTIPETELSGRP